MNTPSYGVLSPSSLRKRPLLTATLGLLVSTLCLHGQATSPVADPSPVDALPSDDELIVLSPFEVSTDKEVGFVPNSALTGGRMALELKDSPMAYSALTREFIDALAITDLSDASNWSVNSSRFTDPVGGGDTFNITVPATQRGAGSSNNRQVNFFPHFAPFDSYRMDRLDFGRGPNAVMFGNGTLGGSQVALTKRANFNRSFNRLDFGVGSDAFYRAAFDINRPLGKSFAMRVNGLYQDSEGWRDNAMHDNRAVTATVSYRPGKNTEIRLEGETGKMERQFVYLQHNDRLAGWDGQTTFSGHMSDAIRNGTVAPTTGSNLQNTGENQGVNRRGSGYFVYVPGVGQILDYENDPHTRGGGDGANTPIAGYRSINAGNVGFNTAGGPLLFGQYHDLPGNRFDNALNSPYADFYLPSQSFTNAAKGPTNTQWYNDVQLTASHSFTPNLYVEVAGAMTHAESEIANAAGGIYDTFIDINRTLPNGDANPNFGKTYGDSGVFRKGRQLRETNAVRFAVAYLKDFGKWGNYGFNVMGGRTETDQNSGANRRYSLMLSDSDHRAWSLDNQNFRIRKYWDDNNVSWEPPAGPITFVDNTFAAGNGAVTRNARTITPGWVNEINGASPFQLSQTKYDYAIIATNAKFFKNRLILTGALRRDAYFQKRRESIRQGDYPLDWNGQTLILRPDAPADYYSLKYFPKSGTGVVNGSETFATTRPTTNNALGVPVRQAQYDNDRFQDDYNAPPIDAAKTNHAAGVMVHVTRWASIGFNHATSYSLPTNTTPAIDGSILPPVEATGWDATARLNFFDGKLNFNYNRFVNEETGTYVSAGSGLGQVTTTSPINGLYAANPIGDNSTTGRNIRGAADIYGPANDIRDRENEGHEFEVIGNITKGWRVSGSLGINEVRNVNSYPMSLKYIADHRDQFIQILQDAGGTLDTSVPVAPGAPGTARQRTDHPPGTIVIDMANAVNNYNNIYLNAANYQTKPVVAVDSYVVNVYSDYTVQSGPLKRFRFGLGYQKRGQILAGYRGSDTIVNPANPAQAIDDPSVDAYTPVYVPGYDVWTGTLGYTWVLGRGREIVFNLRIDNLLDQDRPLWSDGIVMRPKGGDYTSPARETVPSRLGEFRRPTSYMLTTTIKL